MKRTFIFLLSILFSIQVFGQKTEFSFELGSGFFSFRGNTTYRTSDFILTFNNGSPDTTYGTRGHYGRISGFSYVMYIQGQRITSRHFIYGLQAGYESLSSIVKITNLMAMDLLLPNYKSINANANSGRYTNGKTTLTNQFITLHPFVGKRLNVVKGIETDLTVGADFAFCTSSYERTIVNSNWGNWDYSFYRDKPKVDSRLRVDMINYYKKIGLDIGYSYGLTNFYQNVWANVWGMKAYSQMIRFGLVFKL